ncbi:MATE family efflux transporter [Fusobacterium gastrosuis]|uniref:MATE family efflux transporter n=1 Tax=Fusobacterium gastrosuis TaxID=1755100 RepID=UPI0029788CF2|nr:MATE family efflux transporter [Fusobacteriaceae bacterium]MDD7409870.1 MATE family efflux transporter [Fusobacteriaceae bacterium]MDY5712451.1 MATE family efflux transporter [Fusobacterium gastrosuis]
MTKSNNSFFKTVIALTLPMALQNLINVGVVSTDIIMLGKLNEVVLSAASLASQIQFVLTLLMFGIGSGATVLTAQYWGKKDVKSIEKIMGIAVKLSFSLSFIFFILGFFFPNFAMKIFTNDNMVIKEGVTYLRIVSISYLLSSISVVYLVLMRSVEKVVVSTIIYALSLVINFIINYVLIFGNFGFPMMGIAGAAIGTLAARLFELSATLYYNFKNKDFVMLKLKYILNEDRFLKRDFLKYSVPTILNELFWSAGMAASAAILGRLGTSIVAANSITSVVRQLSMVVVFGLANTTAILVGREIGSHNYKTAETYAKKLLLFSFIFSLIGVILIYFISPFIIKNYAMTDEIREYLNFSLKILMYYILCQGITASLIVGIFRAGGDTKYALYLDAFSLWAWSIILSAIAAFYFKAPVKFVYFLIMSDEIVKLPFGLWRFKSKKWLNNVTRENKELK